MSKALKVVEADKFIVRDENGQARAEISVTGRGIVALRLRDGRGICRTELTVSSSGTSGLQFYDGTGTTRLVLYLDANTSEPNSPAITLYDIKGEPLADLPARQIPTTPPA
jgi:hypothetical protein